MATIYLPGETEIKMVVVLSSLLQGDLIVKKINDFELSFSECTCSEITMLKIKQLF